MGLPQLWRPEMGAALRWDRDGDDDAYGVDLTGSLYRPLANPLFGFGLQFEGFYRAVDGRSPNGGLRLLFPIRYFGLQPGMEYDFRSGKVRGVLSLAVPLRRGGPFRQGGRFRVDWTWSTGTLSAGITLPLRGRWNGTSRPRSTRPSLPKGTRPSTSEVIRDPALDESLANLRLAARWINDFTTPFFDQGNVGDFLEAVDTLKTSIDEPDELFPEGHTFEAAIALYHRELVRAFTHAVGGDVATGERVAAQARAVLLDEVVLPYNRWLGQRKRHDSLFGFGAQASARFADWAGSSGGVPADRLAATRGVFEEVVTIMDENRQASRRRWGDSRSVWIPLHYALRLEDHDTQVEMDALIERSVQKSFTRANEVSYVINQQFHIELRRQILDTEDYHVLWIHDFKGKNAVGDPDRVSFGFAVRVYLRALIDGVRAYDERETLPQFIILLDQFFYAGSDGARWMKLLQNPLRHSVDLPDGFEEWEQEIRDTQQELRDAVAGSAKLQAGLGAYGRGWLENQIKVHVNITNPADPSFTGAHMFGLMFFLPDDMMRDHRKIAFYDVTEADPSKGEAIFTGMGVAEHYVGPTWEDRAVLIRGPAILDVKREARELLLSQGFEEDEIPPPLRPQPMPDDYDDQVHRLEERLVRGAVALQVHNATGYGQKWSNVARAALYNLMPAGSSILIPDSLWNSPFWQGMLVGNALRGGRIFVMVPSVANSPGDPAPVISRANEIFTRFLIIQEELADQMDAAGGVLRTGIYNVEGASDLAGEIEDMTARVRQADPVIRAIFPFDASLLDLLETLPRKLTESGYQPAVLAPDAVRRDRKVHLKSQIFISQEAISSLVPRPEMVSMADKYIRLRADQLSRTDASVREFQLAMEADREAMLRAWWDDLSVEARERIVMYLTVGSHNMDNRGQVMDGEVSVVVSGLYAMTAYFNFFYLVNVTTWVESVEELEAMLPPANFLIRMLGRYSKNAL